VEIRPTTAPAPMALPRSMMTSRSVPDFKRFSVSSPLSKPAAAEPEPVKPVDANAQSPTISQDAVATSPAMQQLSALTEKEKGPKTIKSRLRRAFSFSSSQELRRATAENNMAAERAKLRKEKYEKETDAPTAAAAAAAAADAPAATTADNDDDEDAAIVAKQEAGGIGASIYSGQGVEFTGSTDNISISSTASSASIMLRKMGRGVKRSTKNLRNLFRPKSIIGSSGADKLADDSGISSAEVSAVTVEAERERVNVNLDPHDVPGGGTNYPKLERNSMDASREDLEMDDSQDNQSWTRRSIVGSEKDRAEVLAAVRKGILKRKVSIVLSP
jgi:hypothetical protein